MSKMVRCLRIGRVRQVLGISVNDESDFPGMRFAPSGLRFARAIVDATAHMGKEKMI
jgi:hypothetical protein